MKKIISLGIIGFSVFCFNLKETFAYSSSNYENRGLCGNFEVASFDANGTIKAVSCKSNYNDAKSYMKSNGADNLAIMTKVAGKTKIIDANLALLDLSVNPTAITYFYNNSNTSTAYTYMDTGSLYGGVDGAHIDTVYSSTKNKWMVKVKIGNYTGWIEQQAYEIVPLTWVKSSSSYTVANNEIRHNYVAKIQNTYTGSGGRTIGPKPTMLNNGTYYSYDGHYFYTNLKTLIKDYKNNNYNNSVNKNNPYYNYYMYLSNHTRTSYSSINIDEYIRNNMGIKQNAYGNASKNGSSRLYGMGTFFYYAQEKYGVNAVLSLSLSRNETGNGTSNLAINKNNGFGLNAVDSSPTESANWYASFPSSILGYASKWITYGYAHPRDWRYFGPQFGDKWIGMNVKYASDTYWSEKMAANYYQLDKALGLQDYNYYQLGVVTGQTNAYQSPSTSSKFIYSYPEAEDGVVIVGEVTSGNEKWYKVVSDLNINSNYNEVTSGNYNWNGYVYVKASSVKKINTGKNGYISPNNTTEYKNKKYEYDLYVVNTALKPKVAVTTKNTPYYYDSSLASKTGKTLLKDRYVMVYSAALVNNQPVAYLVTSDYWYDQKEWVSADSLRFVKANYGKVSVTVSGNQYTWVNYNTVDAKSSLISGLYTNSYVPVLEQKTVSGYKWYKVPVSLTDSKNIYGYTLASAPGVSITLSTSTVGNILPGITAVDKTIYVGEEFNALEGVTASDQEDGNLTSKIIVTKNAVDINKAGTYEVTYQVTDKDNGVAEKTITVTVKESKAPIIVANDLTIIKGDSFEPLKNVTATDEEDGDITKNIKVAENNAKTDTVGTYKVIYEVTDSHNKKTTKEIKVTVKESEPPVINASDVNIVKGTEFKPLEGVTATDEEDGNLTKNIKVVESTVKTNSLGTYKVVYEVVDSHGKKTTKEIKVTVTKDKVPVINAEDMMTLLDEEFDELEGVTATDPEDGDITKDIKVIKNDVDTSKEGVYEVTYQVSDSSDNTVEKTINVEVVDFDFESFEPKDASFYFEYLKVINNELTIKGYNTIKGVNNTLDKDLYFGIYGESLNGGEDYIQILDRITDKSEMTRPVFSSDGKDYTYSWFKGALDLESMPVGDYRLSIVTIDFDDECFSISTVSNKILKEQVGSFSGKKHVTTRNNYLDDELPLELIVRDEKIGDKTATSTYNQYNQYRALEFKNDKLHLMGTSYSYGMNLATSASITRNLVFENTENYKKYSYNLGSITNGMYKVGTTLGDKLDKTRAWFDTTIDVSNIPKGNYAIYITNSANIKDYGELNELIQRDISKVKLEKNNKTYSFEVNKDKRYRIELNVE